MSSGQFSEESLMAFMDWIGAKGLANKRTASSRKTAAQKILAILEPAEKEDLREIDREAIFSRFQNLSKSNYTPDSLKVYRSRFNSALDDFLRHANDPSGFKPAIANRTKPEKKGRENPQRSNAGKRIQVAAPTTSHQLTGDANQSSGAMDGQLTLPIPLRPNVMVKIFGLPADLTEEESRKICAVVSAYATTAK